MIPICRGCIRGAHCGGQPGFMNDGSEAQCRCLVCEWVAR